jgi:glycosyltransferase involved in cell wall biosynthesis
MVVKNERGRYLEQALKQHRQYIDDAVIIDDASTDNTIEIVEQALEGIPLKLIRNDSSKFLNEIQLRKQQWEETISVNPEWILNMDADEIFENRFVEEADSLMRTSGVYLYCFRLYDLWTSNSYRDDAYWQSHHIYRPFLLRYLPGYDYRWKETAQHCGRFPENIFEFPNRMSDLRIKHYGWAKREERLSKVKRYLLLDPGLQLGDKGQYMSILDRNPNLVEWIE